MATKAFARRPRINPPVMPSGEFSLQPPPELPRPQPTSPMTYILPIGMLAMVVGLVIVGGRNTSSLMMGGMMLVMTVSMLGSSRSGRQGSTQISADRHDYLAYLASVRRDVTEVRDQQREAANWTHPAPDALWTMIGTPRMWERRPFDEDFAEVRLGTGRQQLAAPLRPPQSGPIHEVDPISAVALSQFVRTHGSVDGLPVSVQLGGFPVIEIGGDRDAARAMVRAALSQLLTFHGPDVVAVAVAADAAGSAHWDWLKWLPHHQHPTQVDSLGALRLTTSSIADLSTLLSDQLAGRARFVERTPLDLDQQHLVIIRDGALDDTDDDGSLMGLTGVTVIDLSPSPLRPLAAQGLRLVVTDGQVGILQDDDVDWLGQADHLSMAETNSLARGMSAYALTEGVSDAEGAVTSNDLSDLLGLSDVGTLDPSLTWGHRSARELLRVPIGLGPQGEVVELDIKESAQGGMGPHGLLVGATGSGKSELLRTLVLAMAIEHSPEQLNLVLIDFKGGATFAGLNDLPHTAAMITNLQDDLAMVDRMHEALSGEMNRRQELLRSAGNAVNVREYERIRNTGADLPPLPSLFIVCDEFSELLAQKPDFAELFVAIGRLGRSLGLHLLLASQRLEEGKLRGLDSHLSYRVGLKTFSAGESRTVLGVPDAYDLPPVPGNGFLKVDSTTMLRFKAAYVSGLYQAQNQPRRTSTMGYRRPVSFVASRVDLTAQPAPPRTDELDLAHIAAAAAAQSAAHTSRTVLDVAVARMHGHGSPAHEVWLPPLTTSATLDQLLGSFAVVDGVGLRATSWDRPLRIPVGLVDLPFEQRRDPLILDLSGAAGNAAVVGGPRSGKSLTLRTMVSALALTQTPRQVQCYIIDLGGGALGATAALPHVGGVATRGDTAQLRRLLAEVFGVLADREQRFRSLGVESMADYRALQAHNDPRVADDPHGDVFLVIDGWGAFREDFPDLEERVNRMASTGLSYGIHVMISANRWQEIRPALKDSIGSRLELRLGDSYETEVDRALAQSVPTGSPGRGLTTSKRHMLIALARLDGSPDQATVAQGFSELAQAVTQSWTGPRAPQVRMLPEQVALTGLPLPAGNRAMPIGIDEDALDAVFVDFDADAHLVYFADGESGKTTFLRTLATGIMTRFSHDEARVLMVDYRRTMLGYLPAEYLAGYAAGAAGLEAYLADMIPILQERIPGPDVTVEQLRTRSWWTGPEVFVLVDDYDLVATGNHPLLALRDLLGQAKDIGLHLVLTRRSSGASRALFDPVIQSLRDLGSPGFVGSGVPDEGALWGSAKPQPYNPGRGVLVSRKTGQRLVQIAMPEEE